MRSWLFAPGDSEKKMGKAHDSDADMVIFDLEDAVAHENKMQARALVREFLGRDETDHQKVFVRVNPMDGPWTLDDLAAVMPGRPGGIMLPKVGSRKDVEVLDNYLSALEAANGIERGSTSVMILVTETAGSMFHCGDFAGAPRLVGMTWGAEDLADSIGASGNTDEHGNYGFTYELARSLCLLGASTANVPAIDTIHGDFRDLDGLEKRARRVRREGFRGMLAIHPAQVEIINAAFTPDAEEIAEAREIVALFEAHPGVGAIGYKGGMVDRPHLSRARQLLAQAGSEG
ncbi:HpcH/HpaI aldolase/citrate lyase family protein [Aurantiacibacter hainanensis]|uniref:HpcH/HpaI aldolase/citrate lyase family protein n=1 Tax=Aurantiacibacter hainanensis TaxID=3076114 RepID=UPI0030C6A9DB